MEVTLTGTSAYNRSDKSVLKIRPAKFALLIRGSTPATPTANDSNSTNEFTHSIEFLGNSDEVDSVKNSLAMKLVRSQKDNKTGLLTLVFDFIFWPSKSFM